MASRKPENRWEALFRTWVDGVVYALAVTGVSTLLALVGGITTGGGVVRAKVILFVLGWMLMVYSSLKLWPSQESPVDMPSRNIMGINLSGETREQPTTDNEEQRTDRPKTMGEEQSNRETGDSLPERADNTRFQRFVQALPPNRWVTPPRPERRMSQDGKLLIASVFVLLVSYVMETVFNVAA